MKMIPVHSTFGKRHKIGAIAGIVVAAGVIYVCRSRLEACKNGLPWGVHLERRADGKFEAGVIVPFARMLAIHAPRFHYVHANNKLYKKPKGMFPFFEEVSNQPDLIAFVNDEAIGPKVIVVINRRTGNVVEIDTEGEDTLGMGLDAGSSASPETQEVACLDGSNRISWTHKYDGGTKTWIFDLELKRIVDRNTAAIDEGTPAKGAGRTHE